MPGPWEKYAAAQGSDSAGPQGPWSKYQAPASSDDSGPGFFDGTVKSTIDSLPAIGGVVGGVLGTPADFVAGPMGNVAGAAIGGYAGTAAKNFINSYYDPASAPKTAMQVMGQPIAGGAEQGLMQGTGEGLANAVKPVARAIGSSARWAGAKALSTAFGVNPSAIKEYAQFSDRINSAPTVEALKDVSDDFVGKLAQDVESKKLSVDQAQQALNAHKQEVALHWGDDVAASTQNLSDARADYRSLKDASSSDVAQKTYDVKQALSDAKDKLNAEHGQFVQSLKDQTAPTHLAPDTVEAVNALKKKVTDASGAAFDALQDSDASMPKKQLLSSIDKHMNNLMIQGKAAVGGQAQEGLNSLKTLRGQISQLDDSLSMPDLKQIVQGLDKDINWTGSAGEFTDAASKEKMGVRSDIDAYLKKNVDQYKQIMGPLADSTKLLSDVSSQYGTEQKAYSRLAGIANKSPADQQLLYRLGQETGKDFQSPVAQHLRAKALLSDPTALEQIRQSHPAYQDVQSLEAELANRSTPGFAANQVDQSLQESPQAANLAQAQSAVDQFTPRARAERMAQASTASAPAKAVASAKSGLEQAQSSLAPFKSLSPNGSGQTQVQQKLLQLGKGGNIELTEMFQRLGKLTDTDFVQAMHDNHIQAAFQKGATNGSRNAVRFGAGGGAIGFLIGGIPGATAGTALGANFGGIVDQWGPAITKKILDGVIQVSKKPSVAAIAKLDLPEQVKRGMVIGLEQYMSKGSASPAAALSEVASQGQPANRKPAKGTQHFAEGGEVKILGQIIGYPGSGAPKPKQPKEQDDSSSGGNSLGHAIGYPGYSKGGSVPGTPKVPGNSLKNDTVSAKLSPGEIVLPRSVTMAKNAPQAAAKFVADHLAAKGESKWAAQGLAKLGIQDQALAAKLTAHPKARSLLIQASDLPHGSKALNKIMDQIRKVGA